MRKWSDILPKEANSIGVSLAERAQRERDAGKTIYPAQDRIFAALNLTPPESVKAVIVGQDPYIKEGQANGLAFSVPRGVPLPPSLANIFRELVNDLGCDYPRSGDLTRWAERGVLLLNTSLTVEAGQSASHANWGWERFVVEVLRAAASLPQPIVFLLWGRHAQQFAKPLAGFDRATKAVLMSSHPSPLGATKATRDVPAFLGSCPFSKTNELLDAMGGEKIDWVL